MKYIALDIETTGLFLNGGRGPDKVLMVSIVVEDSAVRPLPKVEDLPHFTCLIRQQQGYNGEAFALQMNSWILKELATQKGVTSDGRYPIYNDNQWLAVAMVFLGKHFSLKEKITVAGKNVAGFDIPFLPTRMTKCFKHRVIDPGSIFIDWGGNGTPSGDDINKKLGLTPVSHDAREDNFGTINQLRATYNVPWFNYTAAMQGRGLLENASLANK